MKKLLLILPLTLFSLAFSQTKNYNSEMKNLKAYVENIYKNDSGKIESYIKNDNNGKIFLIKTNDIYSEFNFEFYYTYDFLRKDDKVIYARKTYISPSGDSSIFYEYYFNNDGRLIGAKKNVSSFYGENSKVVYYTIEYELSDKTDKLERVSETYTDEDNRRIKKDSKLYKEAVENGLIYSYILDLDKITFRDLEGFMRVEEIKYYKNEPKTTIPDSGKTIEKRKVTSENNKSENENSLVGIDRHLVSFIPGTMGRGGVQPSHNCSVSGIITIGYTVNQLGDVISAGRISGNKDDCTVSTAIQWVKHYVKAEKSAISSKGTYKIIF